MENLAILRVRILFLSVAFKIGSEFVQNPFALFCFLSFKIPALL